MRLLFIFLVVIVSASDYDSIKKEFYKSYFFDCDITLTCQYIGKPESELLGKCIEETPEEDLDVIADLLSLGEEVANGQSALEALESVYCKLSTNEQYSRFEDFVSGLKPYFDSDCASKNGEERCQNIRHLINCIIENVNQLHDAEKC